MLGTTPCKNGNILAISETEQIDLLLGNRREYKEINPLIQVRPQKKDFDRAIAEHDEAIRLDPTNAHYIWKRAVNRVHQKQYDRALADYKEAFRIDPKSYTNGLAWMFATCPSEGVRDGKKAVELASHACELSDWKNANDLDTLAAAHAEVGNFDKAVEWQEKAIQLGTDKEKNQKYQERLRLYKEKRPYRNTE